MTKLSDKNIFTAPFQNEHDINNYIFKTKRVEIKIANNYDIALVLGCSVTEVMMKRADEAILLYERGIVKKLFLTGGVGFLSMNRNNSEANVMKKYMVSKGVPVEDIFVEDRSRDTYENMKNSLEEIEKQCGKDGEIILVTSDFHEKRAKGVLEKMTPCSIYAYGVLDGKHDIDTWPYEGFLVHKMIRTEALLLAWYTKKGIIDDQEVEEVYRIRR